MKNIEKRKGIWIPIEFMENTKLDWPNKVLLSEISSFYRLGNGCYASNEFFGSLLGITKSSASKRITQLSALGYIKTENVFERGMCIGRIITPTEEKTKTDKATKERAQQKSSISENHEVVPGQPGGSSQENHEVVLGQPGGSSQENHEVVPEQLGGSSLTISGVVLERLGGSSSTTSGVVPERPGGSSPENTNNIITNTDILKELKKEKEEEIIQTLVYNTGENPEMSSSFSEKVGKKSPIAEERARMNYWFFDYPKWESDLLKLGLEKFIQKTKDYHFNDPAYIGMIRDFYER